jgi:hypothetical protein
MLKIIPIVLVLLTGTLVTAGYAAPEISKKEYCDYTYKVFSDFNSGKIYLACAGSSQTLELKIINPHTFDIERSYPLDGLLQGIVTSTDGLSMYILLVEVDGDENTPDGALRQVSISNGEILKEIVFNTSPLDMAVTKNQAKAFITSMGIDQGQLIAIDLKTFTMTSQVNFGEIPDHAVLTPDDSRLFVKSEEIFMDLETKNPFWKIGIFSTDDLTWVDTISLPYMPTSLLMTPDGTLLISNAIPYTEYKTDICLTAVNSSDLKTVKVVSFKETGIWEMHLDSSGKKLYCIVSPKNVPEPDTEELVHAPSGVIVTLNLTDFSHTETKVTDESLWDIAVTGNDTLFAITADSSNVYIIPAK